MFSLPIFLPKKLYWIHSLLTIAAWFFSLKLSIHSDPTIIKEKAAPSEISLYCIGPTNMATNDFISERQTLDPVFILRSVIYAPYDNILQWNHCANAPRHSYALPVSLFLLSPKGKQSSREYSSLNMWQSSCPRERRKPASKISLRVISELKLADKRSWNAINAYILEICYVFQLFIVFAWCDIQHCTFPIITAQISHRCTSDYCLPKGAFF